ncbi:MAG TPA: ABC transporter ATP-binding protein [Clostridiales bacterium]|jgi:putative ABC transport system ATP-binding protein|nr:ABC transporter ATP-binding protein [Clostridiales bacterium]
MNICAKNIEKEYMQGESRIIALRETSLEIAQEKFSVIVGPSGSGKSTLLRILGGLLYPTRGEVLYNDVSIYKLSAGKQALLRRKTIGYVFQDYGLLPTLTALENICTPVLMDNKKPDMEHILDLCDTLGIQERVHHIPGEMSGGEQQRVAVARALANNPEILFADEPTGNLDKKTANAMMESILSAQKKYKKTVVMVTHDESLAQKADFVFKLDNGCLMR